MQVTRKYEIEFIFRIGDIADVEKDTVKTYKNMDKFKNIQDLEKYLKNTKKYDYVGITHVVEKVG